MPIFRQELPVLLLSDVLHTGQLLSTLWPSPVASRPSLNTTLSLRTGPEWQARQRSVQLLSDILRRPS